MRSEERLLKRGGNNGAGKMDKEGASMAHKVRDMVPVSAGTPGIDLFWSPFWCNDDEVQAFCRSI